MRGPSIERRKAPRVAAECRVEFKDLGRPTDTYADLSRDLSTGGVFIETSVGLEVGTEVALEITPGGGVPPIRLLGIVARVEAQPAQSGSKETRRTRGMALRFTSGELGELERLVSLVERARREGAHGQLQSRHDGRR